MYEKNVNLAGYFYYALFQAVILSNDAKMWKYYVILCI